MSYRHTEAQRTTSVQEPGVAVKRAYLPWYTPLINAAIQSAAAFVASITLASLVVAVFSTGLSTFGWAIGAWALATSGLFVYEARTYTNDIHDETYSYRVYTDRMRDAHIDAYTQAAGITQQETVSETTITADNPMHLTWVALEIHRRAMAGQSWGIHALTGPLFARDGQSNSQRRVGQLTQDSAAACLDTLARRGLIQGRKNNYAGEWVALDEGDVLHRLGVGQ